MPQVTTSRGKTRIYLEGSTIWEPQRAAKEEPEDKSHVVNGVAYGVVYANPTARRAMRATVGTPKFPAGSIIVREALAKPGDEKPLLVVAMVKRAPGFNSKGGDWEFLNINPSLTKINERQKKGSCLECHSSQRENDFVFPLPSAPLAPPRVTF